MSIKAHTEMVVKMADTILLCNLTFKSKILRLFNRETSARIWSQRWPNPILQSNSAQRKPQTISVRKPQPVHFVHRNRLP